MQEPVQITLPSGHVVWARVETPSGARAGTGPVDVGRGEPARAVRLEGLREAIEGLAESVHDSLGTFRPAEIGVEFGLEVEVKSGKALAVIADAGAKTSVKVSLKWNTAPDGE